MTDPVLHYYLGQGFILHCQNMCEYVHQPKCGWTCHCLNKVGLLSSDFFFYFQWPMFPNLGLFAPSSFRLVDEGGY